jgi:WD40 repeat protein
MTHWHKRFSHELSLIIVAVLTGSLLLGYASAQEKEQINITLLIPHWGSVTSVALSSDGARVLSGGTDGSIGLGMWHRAN